MRIIAKNFLSWSALDFTFPKGVSTITGFNHDDNTPEGSGKSAILNALAWGLFGTIPKDANIDDVIKEGTTSCLVKIEINHSKYQYVVRSRKPNDLYLLDYEGNKFKGKDVKETQQIVQDLIGLSFETFCQSIYFAQNYNKKFILSSQEEKGKILSDIQDLSQFDRARKEVSELIKTESTKLSSLRFTIRECENTLSHNETERRSAEEYNRTKETHKKETINALEVQIETLIKDQTTLQGEVNQIGDVSDILKQLTSEELQKKQSITEIDGLLRANTSNEKRRNSIDLEISKLVNRAEAGALKINNLNNLGSEPNAKCPTCGSNIGLENNHLHLEAEIAREEAKLLELDLQIKELSLSKSQIQDIITDDLYNAKTELEEQLDLVRRAKQELTILSNKREMLNKQIKGIEVQISAINFKIENLIKEPIVLKDTQIFIVRDQEYKEAIAQLQQTLSLATDRLSRLEKLKDGFKEVKSHVFNSILNELTNKTNQYLQQLFHVPVSIQFINDDHKIKTEIQFDGSSRGLGLLSGGQLRRVILATDLALSDIVYFRKSKLFNFIVLDEAFKDLSETSMQKCLTLLKSLNKSVVLIEHNTLFNQIIDVAFQVELENGTSRMVSNGS